MAYTTIETKQINWPDQANWPNGPASFPVPTLDNISADSIGYSPSGDGQFIEGTGVQFRNSLNRTVLFLGRSKPDEVVLLDQALAEAIRLELGLDQTIVVEGSSVARPITRQDMLNLRSLTAEGVSDLTGIGYATNLKVLSLPNGSFRNIDELRALTNLERLNLTGCTNLTSVAALQDMDLVLVNMTGVPYSQQIANQINPLDYQVIETTGLFGSNIRLLELELTDAHLPVPNGDTLTLTYLLRHDPSTGRYNLLLLEIDANHAYDIDSYELRLTVDDTLHNEVDIENIQHADIFLMLNTQMYIQAISDGDAVLKTNVEYLNPTGSINDPSDTAMPVTDAGLTQAIEDYTFTDTLLLKNMVKLRKFEAPAYEIINIDSLSLARNIEILDLSFNLLTAISSETFSKLTHLNLMNNRDLADAFDIDPTNIDWINVVGLPETNDLITFTDTLVSNGSVAVTDYSLNHFPIPYQLSDLNGNAVNKYINFECSYNPNSRTFYGSVILLNNTDNINTIDVYDGNLCEEPDPDHLITTYSYALSADTIESVVSTSPTVIEVTNHGYNEGDTVEINGNHYRVSIVSADELELLDTDYVPSLPQAIGHSTIQINHDMLTQLGTKFFMILKNGSTPIYRFDFEYDGYQAVNYNIYTSSLDSANERPMTDASKRQVAGATNASPISVTYTGPVMDDFDAVQIEGVGGNTAANGDFIIEHTDTNEIDLIGSTGNDTYTSGGTITPIPSDATGGITARAVVNPFLERWIYEINGTHTLQNPTEAWIETPNRRYIDINPSMSSEIIDNVDGRDIYEHTFQINLHSAEASLMALPTALPWYINIYSNTYLEGAICTPQANRSIELAEMNNVYVKIKTTQQVEGFDVDDLIVTLPPVGSYPKMIGPFSATFHASGTINNRQFNDLIQLEFASDIANATPTTGDIQLAAYRIGS